MNDKSEGFGSPQHIAMLEKAMAASESGWGGMLPSGQIVDRREHPDAIPLQENSMMGIPKPKQKGGTE